MDVKVIGAGCPDCDKLKASTEEALKELGISAEIQRISSLKDIVLLPGETDDCMWASFGKVNWMIRSGRICKIIGRQFRKQENALRLRNVNNISK